MDSQKKPERKEVIVLTSIARLQEVLEEEIAAGRNPKTPEDWERVMNLMIAYGMVDDVIPVEGGITLEKIKQELSSNFNVGDLKDL
jgi:hypothetical protein